MAEYNKKKIQEKALDYTKENGGNDDEYIGYLVHKSFIRGYNECWDELNNDNQVEKSKPIKLRIGEFELSGDLGHKLMIVRYEDNDQKCTPIVYWFKRYDGHQLQLCPLRLEPNCDYEIFFHLLRKAQLYIHGVLSKEDMVVNPAIPYAPAELINDPVLDDLYDEVAKSETNK